MKIKFKSVGEEPTLINLFSKMDSFLWVYGVSLIKLYFKATVIAQKLTRASKA